MSTASSIRIQSRISPDLHSLIKQAAEMKGQSMNDFFANAIQDAVLFSIEQVGMAQLSLSDQECFARITLTPVFSDFAIEITSDLRQSLSHSE